MENNTASPARPNWYVHTSPNEDDRRFIREEGTLNIIARIPNSPYHDADAYAAFIVRTCNAHERLLAAAKELIAGLEDADEADHEDVRELKAAIAQAEA